MSRADQGNDWLRWRGAPPVPSGVPENIPAKKKFQGGSGPYHVKSSSDLDGFASPKRKKLLVGSENETRKKNHDLQKKFVKLMQDDMFGSTGSGSNRARFGSQK